jgi:dihydroorotate dehydrogenase (fumarate)
MLDLTTTYAGFKLKNPIIIGSSGLTESVASLKELEKRGAAAIVLKSLFEEEIIREMEDSMNQMNAPGHIYPEIYDFFDMTAIEDSSTKYLNLIREAKKELNIPIFASVNCVSSDEWTYFAKRAQDAGADGIELNLFVLPSDFNRTGVENEKIYFDVIEKVKKEITIPLVIKISYYFSNLGAMIQKISESGIDALVLFNRFFTPDIDLETMKIVPSNIFSTQSELSTSLRWIAIMADRVKCDLAGSTGIHEGTDVIKQLLAGAKAVHIASTLYKHGTSHIENMLKDIKDWMEDNNYSSIGDFCGKMSQSKSINAAAYERVQFMKHFSGK